MIPKNEKQICAVIPDTETLTSPHFTLRERNKYLYGLVSFVEREIF